MKWVVCTMALLSVIFGACSGRMADVSTAAIQDGGKAITLMLTLAGSICLWSGLMEIAQRAGLTKLIAKLLSPVTRLLFPRLTDDPDTRGVISLNITANLLGLGNAATPLGLDAMERLRTRAPIEGKATDEMITLVVLNTCSIQLIPSTAASLRLAAGSANPMEILVPVLISSGISLLLALILVKTGCRLFPYQGRKKEGGSQ